MKSHPILFSGQTVRDLLAGKKVQTRRLSDRWMKLKAGDELTVIELRETPRANSQKYMAGSDGNIYSRRSGKWVILKPTSGSKDYPLVSICFLGKKRTETVHSLICEAFYGTRPSPELQVRHLDGNRGNSAPENLCWGTQEENWTDRKAQGSGIEGEKHHASKLSDVEREHVKWAIEKGLCSQRNVARILGITQSAVSQMVNQCERSPSKPAAISPRYSRITLRATADARRERLHDISEADAVAEGVERLVIPGTETMDFGNGPVRVHPMTSSYGEAYAALWDSLHGKDAPWSSNPEVTVLSFEVRS